MWQEHIYPTLTPNTAAQAKLIEGEEALEEWVDAFTHLAVDVLNGVI